MTEVPRPTGRNGGFAARRAVVRWAWRSFRREWRQQVLVLGLLTLAVAAAIGFATATYNTAGVREDATFGASHHRVDVAEPHLARLPAAASAASAAFGEVDVIAHWTRPVPGSVASVEYRAQDPNGPFSAPMLALRTGRYPDAADEAALTVSAAEILQAAVGQVVDLDGDRRTVVGIVENPSNLNDDFVLVAPGERDPTASVTMLVGGSGEFEEVVALRRFGEQHLSDGEVTTRQSLTRTQEAGIVVAVGQVALVLVALVASAGFAALAQRRLRQLGMLGAVGATEPQLRLVVVANGAVVGLLAAVFGVTAGLLSWIVAAPAMEEAAGYRIDPLNVPWWLVAVTAVCVVLAATLAAWWPARIASRVPITRALSGRPPDPGSVRNSVAAATALLVAGLLLLTIGRSFPLLLSVGTILTVVGVLLLSPAAVRWLGGLAGPLPIAPRLALRDLARYRARSSVALAALGLALGVPVAIVVTASAAAADTGLGNLGEEQLLVWTRDPSQPEGVSPFYTQDPNDEGFSPYLPHLTASELTAMGRAVAGLAAALESATVVPIDVVVDPQVADPDGQRAVTLARPTEIGYLDVSLLYLATPDLLHRAGVEADTVPSDQVVLSSAPAGPTDIVTDHDELWLTNASGPPSRLDAVTPIDPGYTSLPASFITPEAVQDRGWTTRRVGWLVDATDPVDASEVATARDLAAEHGLLVEVRQEQASLVALRWGATAAGAALALGVLAMTVGIIRAEAARDVRILTAAGATSTARRLLTASTAGGLALLGALLATATAYLTLTAGYLGAAPILASVPIAHLAVILAGVPLLAAAAGWLLAGTEPSAIAHQPIE